MRRWIRFWIRQSFEMAEVSILIAIGIAVLKVIINGSIQSIQIAGVLLMVTFAIMNYFINSQSMQLISISMLFGGTRKSSVLGIHLMNALLFVLVEFLQLVFYFLPFMNQELQLDLIKYTPIVYLSLSGISYLIANLQIRAERLFVIINIFVCLIVGGIMGFFGVVSIVLFDDNWFMIQNGMFSILFLLGSVGLYTWGSLVYTKTIQNLDVRV